MSTETKMRMEASVFEKWMHDVLLKRGYDEVAPPPL